MFRCLLKGMGTLNRGLTGGTDGDLFPKGVGAVIEVELLAKELALAINRFAIVQSVRGGLDR
jgi:hypothetical protein